MTGILLFVLKLTIVLLLGATAAALLRTRSAAARHFVWAATLASALLLPIVSSLAPPVAVTVPNWREAAVAAAPIPRPTIASQRRVDAAHRPGAIPVTPQPRTRLPLATIAAGLWLTGVAAMLLWLAAGQLTVLRIARNATHADSGEWPALIEEARQRIPVKRPVCVALSARVAAPFTSGWTRPIIVLPADASNWPAERRRAALLHELAHVARNDAPVHLLAGLACALYWLHPAVWLALRKLRREGEQATDDQVIARGMVAPDYAAQLVDVARAARTRGFSGLAAVAMACPSHLETRLRALLDDTRIRGAVSRRLAVIAVAVVALILVPLAAARPEVRGDVAPEKSSRRVVQSTSRPAIDYERSVDAKSGCTLVLDLETGADIEIQGDDTERVDVRGELSGRDADSTIVDTTSAGGEVRVTTTFAKRSETHSTSHDFVLRVPRRFNVRVSSAGGGVSIHDVEGTFEGSTGGGTIELSRVRGTARLSTGGGDIFVTDSELHGRVSSGGGTVRFERVLGDLRGDSSGMPAVRAGAVTNAIAAIAAIPAEAPGEVTVNTVAQDESSSKESPRVLRSGAIEISKAGGAVELASAPRGAVINTGGGRIVVGLAGGDVEATTGGGMIRIGPVAGSVRASTGAGRVVIDAVDAGGETQTIDVATGSGHVDITLPANFDGEFDIQTSYTESHDPVRIDSDFDVQREPVTDWDDHEGTPRRYVRAHGSAGNGRGLVRIRAVNGNVTIRRD